MRANIYNLQSMDAKFAQTAGFFGSQKKSSTKQMRTSVADGS